MWEGDAMMIWDRGRERAGEATPFYGGHGVVLKSEEEGMEQRMMR